MSIKHYLYTLTQPEKEVQSDNTSENTCVVGRIYTCAVPVMTIKMSAVKKPIPIKKYTLLVGVLG